MTIILVPMKTDTVVLVFVKAGGINEDVETSE
jgi:hypothetical protein